MQIIEAIGWFLWSVLFFYSITYAIGLYLDWKAMRQNHAAKTR